MWRDTTPRAEITHISPTLTSLGPLSFNFGGVVPKIVVGRDWTPGNFGPCPSDNPIIRVSDFAWRFPAHLVKDESFGELLRGWWLEYSSLNEAQITYPSLFWNAAKAVLRGHIMSFVATYNKTSKLAYDAASSKSHDTYTAFKTCSSPQNRKWWSLAKSEFEIWGDRMENMCRSQYDMERLRFGNKPGRLLANLAKGHRRMTHITALKNKEGIVQTVLKYIHLTLQEF